jgi:putative ABC transport system permease protein
MPMAGDRSTSGMRIEGREVRPGEGIEVHYRVVTPGYFRVMNIPLRAGRELGEQDTRNAPGAVMLNETTARRYWPNEDPTGKRVRIGPNPNAPWLTIVGVAGDARNFGLDADARPEVYIPYQQSPDQRMRLVVRTEVAPHSLTPAVREAVRAVDRDLPLAQVMTLEELLGKSVAQRQLNMWLLGVFAALAFLLAALGAQTGAVLKLVVKQGMTLALTRLGVGLIASLALTRLMKGLLFGVSATDPMTYVMITLLLTGVALVACWIPARRAAKVDPIVALRCD